MPALLVTPEEVRDDVCCCCQPLKRLFAGGCKRSDWADFEFLVTIPALSSVGNNPGCGCSGCDQIAGSYLFGGAMAHSVFDPYCCVGSDVPADVRAIYRLACFPSECATWLVECEVEQGPFNTRSPCNQTYQFGGVNSYLEFAYLCKTNQTTVTCGVIVTSNGCDSCRGGVANTGRFRGVFSGRFDCDAMSQTLSFLDWSGTGACYYAGGSVSFVKV